MSKSYNNVIEIFDTAKSTQKTCARIVTDSTPLEEPKDPTKCNVYALIKLFATADEANEIAAAYRAGGYGYGHAKKRLAEMINDRFADSRTRYDDLIVRTDYLMDILAAGGAKARASAEMTMERVRAASGIIRTH
jgi:tryptophanyl-tRNA synthetase